MSTDETDGPDNPGVSGQANKPGSAGGPETPGNTEGKDEYEVGYGKPPKQSQFKKGKSGNPKGRPRKRRPQVGPDAATCPPEQTKDLLRDALYRAVPVPGGNQRGEMSVLEVLINRAISLASKGDAPLLRLLLGANMKIEAERKMDHMRTVEDMYALKVKRQQQYADARRNGLPEPDLFPHPEDIHVDVRTGAIRVNGPVSKEERAALQEVIRKRDEWIEEIGELRRGIANGELADHSESVQSDFKFAEDWVAMINEMLPERYRRSADDVFDAQGVAKKPS